MNDKERLAALLRDSGFTFSPDQVQQFTDLVGTLLRWNRHRNLTAITELDEIFEKHLFDSLTLMPQAKNTYRLLDIGSGAGFPALPLKIACPELRVVTVDSVAKKVAFQRHVVRALGLSGYTAIHGRAENLFENPICQAGFDLVVARALGSLPMLADLARPLLSSGGRLVAMKGSEAAVELQEHGPALSQAGWRVATTFLTLPLSGAERCLVEMTVNAGI